MDDFNQLLYSEGRTDLTRRFECDTGVITLTSFPTCRAIVVRIKRKAEVTTLCRSGLFFICLVGRHIENAIKRLQPDPRKTQNTKLTKLTFTE